MKSLRVPPSMFTSPTAKLDVALFAVNVRTNVGSLVFEPLTTTIPLLLAAVIAIVVCVVLITKFLFADSELALPGCGNVSTALLPATSFIVPPFKANAVVL